MSALEVRFSRRGPIQIYVYLYSYITDGQLLTISYITVKVNAVNYMYIVQYNKC